MSEEKIEKGGISVQTEHIFPVIKRWLYSDKEIFLREIVSNACDAVTKMKRLVSLGKAEFDGAYRIDVRIDPNEKTLTVSDNGIGMSAEEVKKYICQIALSGALEFIEKYEGENAAGDGIIGHFGLGFYSAFMVSERVDVLTKSFDGSPAAEWSCGENGDYELAEGDRTERGTDVVMHVTDDEKEFLNKSRIEGLLKKYCAFMPVEIYLEEVGEEEEKKEDKKDEKDAAPKPVNDTSPLWLKNPSDCTDEEYKKFYHDLFGDFNDPLFYVHINADFPLNFKGILYFPKLRHEFANMEGEVKLYYNQVFVADNIKEVVPEYLMLLKGVLDCPELPLNVSRSYLQNSGYVSKITAHIVKKVCDKLNALFNNDRKTFEGFWDDVKPFVEYGCMKDRKFFDRAKAVIVYRTVSGDCLTLDEYLDRTKDKTDGKKVYYANDLTRQASYISLFEQQEIPVIELNAIIDNQFISFMEDENKDVSFVRVDSEIDGVLKGEGEAEKNERLEALFKKAAGENTEIAFENLKSEKTPAMITFTEQQRRFDDMMKLYSARNGMDMPSSAAQKLVVNLKCPIIAKLDGIAADSSKGELADRMAKQIYMLAVLAQRQLGADETKQFISDTLEILGGLS